MDIFTTEIPQRFVKTIDVDQSHSPAMSRYGVKNGNSTNNSQILERRTIDERMTEESPSMGMLSQYNLDVNK